MKLFLTEQAEQELKVLNKRLLAAAELETYDEAWDSLNEHELLLIDANMYVEDAYLENEFDNFNEWCKVTAEVEYDPKYLVKHPDVVKDKINVMIRKNIIIIK
jgi:hypothetical protein